jgi:hypothetical protein
MGFNTYADVERQRDELGTDVPESIHVGNSGSEFSSVFLIHVLGISSRALDG